MGRLPLEGIRVVDHTAIFAGPVAARILGDLGAEVIHIEGTTRPDAGRQYNQCENDTSPGWWDRSGYFLKKNMSKYGIVLNLNVPKAREIFKQLAAKSDVVIDNFSPRVMEGWGLGYAALKAIKPDIIYIVMPAYGMSGPWRDRFGTGQALESAVGFTWITGYRDGPPIRCPLPYTDPWSGITAAAAVGAAIFYRTRTGKGQFIDCAQTENVLDWVGEWILDYMVNGRLGERTGNRHRTMAPHGIYRCKGHDMWVAIAIGSDEEWERFVEVMGDPSWAADEKYSTAAGRFNNQNELDENINQWTNSHDHYEVMHMLQQAGVASGAVLKNKELLWDPHLRERAYWQIVDHPVIGRRPYPRQIVGKFSETSTDARFTAPLFGQHTEEVLSRVLGMSPEEVEELEKEGATGKRPAYADLPYPLLPNIGVDFQSYLKYGYIAEHDYDYLEQLKRIGLL